MAVADSSGLPAAACLAGTAPHEATLVETSLAILFIAEKPEKPLAAKAYDSDKLNDDLQKNQMLSWSPRSNRTVPKTQDGRKLRRHKRRSGKSNGFQTSGGWLSDLSDILIISWLFLR